jgi:hypothetical protein
VKKDNLILETFLRLTSRTYPYGTEDELVNSMIEQGIFPSDLQKDTHGNYFYKIGESRTIFASHLDTVSKEATTVTHTFDDYMIGTDGKTTLGADDKAGVTVMLHLIKNNIPGLYYFFIGEEVGCIGSGLASSMSIKDFKGNYDRIISFDRRGTDSVITYQSSTRCCSDDFADSLARQLNLSGMKYKKDDGGVYTDSAEFTDIIPECTNLSVGYYKEHTVNETQDIKHLEELATACLLVDWENLPTKRDMTQKEYKSYNYNRYGTNYKSTTYTPKSNDWRRRDYGYHDDWYDQGPQDDAPIDNSADIDNDVDWEIEYGRYKKSRRSNKKKGRSYIDTGFGGLEPYDDRKTIAYKGTTISNTVSDRNYYDNLIDKIVKDDLTKEDLEVIKDQYLDMNTDNDRMFYQYLLGNIID